MKDVLELVIKSLVENQTEVSINEKEDGKTITFEVQVAGSDMGKVIGKQGKMAKAIRTLMKSVAGKNHKKVNIEFLD